MLRSYADVAKAAEVSDALGGAKLVASQKDAPEARKILAEARAQGG